MGNRGAGADADRGLPERRRAGRVDGQRPQGHGGGATPCFVGHERDVGGYGPGPGLVARTEHLGSDAAGAVSGGARQPVSNGVDAGDPFSEFHGSHGRHPGGSVFRARRQPEGGRRVDRVGAARGRPRGHSRVLQFAELDPRQRQPARAAGFAFPGERAGRVLADSEVGQGRVQPGHLQLPVRPEITRRADAPRYARGHEHQRDREPQRGHGHSRDGAGALFQQQGSARLVHG